MLLRGIASRYLVELHIIVNKYSFCDFVLGNSPTQSIIMCEKGSSKANMGCKGACGIFWLGLPPNWQVWHSLNHFATSRFRTGKKNVVKLYYGFYVPPNDQTLASHVPIPRPLLCVLLLPQSGTLFRLSHYCHIL